MITVGTLNGKLATILDEYTFDIYVDLLHYSLIYTLSLNDQSCHNNEICFFKWILFKIYANKDILMRKFSNI